MKGQPKTRVDMVDILLGICMFSILVIGIVVVLNHLKEYKNKGVRINCTIEDITIPIGRGGSSNVEVEDNNGKSEVFYIQGFIEELESKIKKGDEITLQEYVNDKGTHSYYVIKEINGEKVNLESKLIKKNR